MSCQLSVLIGLPSGATGIKSCLEALEPQLSERVEVIVADGTAGVLGGSLPGRFPWVRLVRCGQLNSAELRLEAFKVSTGKLVALLDPHVEPGSGWVSAALQAGRLDRPVVGGAVQPDPAAVRGNGAWAAFLCEYADFLPPLPPGPTSLAPGNNVLYQRAALEASDLSDGLWKTWVNAELAAAGASCWSDPSLVIRHARPYQLSSFLALRYHNGRCYGARRARGRSPGWRLARLSSVTLLPALFGTRTVRALLRRPRYWRRLVLAQPWLLLFNIAWALGEARGYLAGPGKSCAEL